MNWTLNCCRSRKLLCSAGADYQVAYCMKLSNINQGRAEVTNGEAHMWLARVWRECELQRKHVKQAKASFMRKVSCTRSPVTTDFTLTPWAFAFGWESKYEGSIGLISRGCSQGHSSVKVFVASVRVTGHAGLVSCSAWQRLCCFYHVTSCWWLVGMSILSSTLLQPSVFDMTGAKMPWK